MDKRNVRIDIIKGIGIMLIVLGHTQMPYSRFVNLFHVALFFIASGYCFSEKYSESFANVKVFVVKRIKRLYIPFILWNLAFLCLRNLFVSVEIYSTNKSIVDVYGTIGILSLQESLIQAKNILFMQAGEQLAGACWFLRALLILELAFISIDYILKKVFKEKYYISRWIVAVLMLIVGSELKRKGIVLQFNIATVCSAWCLFVFGIEWKKTYESYKEKIESYKLIDLFMVGICFGLIYILTKYGSISYDSNQYPNIFFFLVAATAGWFLCWGTAGCMEKYLPQLIKLFSYVGTRTIEILFLHFLCFKLVSYIYILVNDLEMYMLASFPVLTNRWWPIYWIVGIVGPLAFGVIYGYLKDKMKNKYMCIGYHCLLGSILLLLFFVNIQSGKLTSDKISEVEIDRTLDYSLVYNTEDYLYYNPDVKVAYGNDEEAIFEHFLQNGMREGRVASEGFDVKYYKDKNGDLGELYQDDYIQYYIHYIKYGYAEGRKGNNKILEKTNCFLTCSLVEKEIVQLTIKTNKEKYHGEKYYVFSLPAYLNIIDGMEAVAEGILDKDNEIMVKMDSLTNKYIVAILKDDQYIPVSNFAYIVNVEKFSDSKIVPPIPATKKGLQCSDTLIEDTLSLNTSYVFRNLVIQNLMCMDNNTVDTIDYTYNGELYYFNKSEIQKMDSAISAQTKAGIVVTASVISIKREGFDPFYYKGIDMETGASYYALNTADNTGQKYVEAFVSFMSDRYDGSNAEYGMICNWVVGNEVNESGTYNYMGPKELTAYMEEYTRTFRIIYNIVKNNIPSASVYVPMEPWWGIGSDTLTYGGKEFLDYLNEKMKQEGNIDWGLAYHAYSFPLSDPKVLNDIERTIDINGELTLDGYVSTDSINSVFISMENIEVLTEYMNEREFLTDDGQVRSIILSEQGYTSNSNVYGKCEAIQAASMVYAYYKAEMNQDIDAFIYFLQRDNSAASLGNEYYQFGLMQQDEDGKIVYKLSHDVFKVMNSKNSLEQLEYMKKILNIKSWDEVIPKFEKDVFAAFKEVNNSQAISIENFTIGKVEEQKYTGMECLPEIKVTYKDSVLENDVDYDVVYHNNVEVGQATAIVVGLGKYSGTQMINFEIKY